MYHGREELSRSKYVRLDNCLCDLRWLRLGRVGYSYVKYFVKEMSRNRRISRNIGGCFGFRVTRMNETCFIWRMLLLASVKTFVTKNNLAVTGAVTVSL